MRLSAASRVASGAPAPLGRRRRRARPPSRRAVCWAWSTCSGASTSSPQRGHLAPLTRRSPRGKGMVRMAGSVSGGFGPSWFQHGILRRGAADAEDIVPILPVDDADDGHLATPPTPELDLLVGAGQPEWLRGRPGRPRGSAADALVHAGGGVRREHQGLVPEVSTAWSSTVYCSLIPTYFSHRGPRGQPGRRAAAGAGALPVQGPRYPPSADSREGDRWTIGPRKDVPVAL